MSGMHHSYETTLGFGFCLIGFVESVAVYANFTISSCCLCGLDWGKGKKGKGKNIISSCSSPSPHPTSSPTQTVPSWPESHPPTS
jgi:hypothetical protein